MADRKEKNDIEQPPQQQEEETSKDVASVDLLANNTKNTPSGPRRQKRKRFLFFLAALLLTVIVAVAVVVVVTVPRTSNTTNQDWAETAVVNIPVQQRPPKDTNCSNGGTNSTTGRGDSEMTEAEAEKALTNWLVDQQISALEDLTSENTTITPQNQAVALLASQGWAFTVTDASDGSDSDGAPDATTTATTRTGQACTPYWSCLDPAMTKESPQGYEFMLRYIMLVLYYSTKGPRWSYDLNFAKENNSICSWYFWLTYVDMSTEIRGVECNPETATIVALRLRKFSSTTFMGLFVPPMDCSVSSDLCYMLYIFLTVVAQNNLEGTLPAELGLLTTLKHLDINFNLLQGSLPETFQALTRLETLQLSGNSLNGTLPPWLDSLGALRKLHFDQNFLNGTLPETLANLEHLQDLALDSNRFTGTVDRIFDATGTNISFFGLQKLETFYADNNWFTGSLGDHFLQKSLQLRHLDISDNLLSGVIPPHFFRYPALTVLDLHDNDFDTMPTEFPVNTNLTLLALQRCKFANQSIPSSISSLQALQYLDLSMNEYTGDIPSQIADLTSLTYMFLAENSFFPGPIPSWLERMSSLTELSLKTTQRTGTIPADLFGTQLADLVLLDLDNNRLTGSIPESFGKLWNLQYLLLNRNELTGALPESFVTLGNIRKCTITLRQTLYSFVHYTARRCGQSTHARPSLRFSLTIQDSPSSKEIQSSRGLPLKRFAVRILVLLLWPTVVIFAIAIAAVSVANQE